MNILALDTSGTYCSVALWQGNGANSRCIDQHEKAERSHTQRLLPMVAEILLQADIKANQLDAIAYGCGPGSFTGIRIAAGVAQGLAYGLDLPLIPVSTLAALAVAAYDKTSAAVDTQYLCCIDARMQEVYTATYRVSDDASDGSRHVSLIQPEQVCDPQKIPIPTDNYGVSGSGAGLATLPAAILANAQWVDAQAEPQAQFMTVLARQALLAGGEFLPEHALPVYLRDEVTWQRLPRFQND